MISGFFLGNAKAFLELIFMLMELDLFHMLAIVTYEGRKSI